MNKKRSEFIPLRLASDAIVRVLVTEYKRANSQRRAELKLLNRDIDFDALCGDSVDEGAE